LRRDVPVGGVDEFNIFCWQFEGRNMIQSRSNKKKKAHATIRIHHAQFTTSQYDPPQMVKPTQAYDLDRAGFRKGNYVEQKNDKDMKTK